MPTAGFVTPAITRLAVLLGASEHPIPANVIVTTLDAPAAVAVQFVNMLPSVIVGAPGTAKLEWNVAVIVPPAANDPPEPTVKATV